MGPMRSVGGGARFRAVYLSTFAEGDPNDYGTPMLGDACDDPKADKDAVRKSLGEEVWQCCELDTVEEPLRVLEVLAQGKHGSCKRLPYRIPYTVGDSMQDQVESVLKSHPGLSLKRKARLAANRFLQSVFDSVKGGPLVPVSLMVAAGSFDNKNLGYPHYVKDRTLLGEYFERSRLLGEQGFPLDDATCFPGLIGGRTVPRGPYLYGKSRFITMWSRVLANWEKTIFIPLSERLKLLPGFCAWNHPRDVNREITRLLYREEGPILSLDYSGFDASVPFEVITEVFALIRNWFGDMDNPMINFIHKAFIGSGLHVPGRYIDGEERKRGIPSGSVLTNLIGSLVNLWVMAYACALQGGSILSWFVQGDDGVYTFSRGIKIPRLAASLLSEFGMVIKLDQNKSLVSATRVMYLQNTFSKSYCIRGWFPGVRPVERALMGMMVHERAPMQTDGWCRKYNAYRWLQQANNCADHPRFEGLCLWLWSKSGYIKEALEKILRNDPEVYLANRLLDVGSGERGKLPVSELQTSPVVRLLVAKGLKRGLS